MATYDIKQITLPGGDIANLKDGNAIHKSNTSGFVKNDGSIDQNTYQIAQEGKGLSTNDFTNEDKALIGQTLGNNTVLTTDKTPFLTRQTLNPTGFSGYVREKLIGASYAWNQLCENGDFSNGNTGWNGNRGSWTVSSGVGSFLATGTPAYGTYNNVPRISGHKYLAIADIKLTSASASSNVRFRFYCGTEAFANLESNTSWQRKAVIVNAPSTASDSNIGIIDARSSGWDAVQVDNAQVIDLTLAFGSTIADYLYSLTNNGGITKLRDMGCPIDKYTPYGYGLYSVKTSGKKIVGKNLFGGEYDVMYPLFIPKGTVVTASINYHGSPFSRIDYFDKNGNNIDYWNVAATSAVSASRHRRTFTILEDAYSFKFTGAPCEDMQIEVGENDTAYEPYIGVTYSLGNDELRGKFDLVNGEIVASGDVKESNGEITRNYLSDFDLGSLNWQAFGSSYPNTFYAEITDGILSSNSAGRDTGSCAKYVVVAKDITAIGDKECTFGSRNVFNNRGSIMLKDTAYSDAATLKTSLSGLYATCKKATPATEQSTPFADPMSLVGATTEEYIDDRTIPCPVGAERQYMGQSDDVVEIPSSPLSDGKRKLVAETSGGKTQYYWEGEEEKDSEDISSDLHAYNGNTLSNVHARKFGKVIELAFTSTGSYESLTGLYVAYLTAYKPAKELNFTLYNAFNVPVGGVWITTTGIIYIRSTVDATLTEIKLNAMYIV